MKKFEIIINKILKNSQLSQSESDYNSFYISKFETFDVDVNEEYLNQ